MRGYNIGLIVTLTINPAIDRIISVDRLAFEDRSYINSSRESAGGRGINVSCVIHSFGGETTAVLISGGDSGKRLESYLGSCGFPFAWCRCRTRSARTSPSRIARSHGQPQRDRSTLGTDGSGARGAAVRDTLAGASWLLMCGSLPPGVPPSFYGKLISKARQKKVKTLLHADGDALREGIEARPTVVAPNQQEAERLLGRTLLTRTHYLEAAEQIRADGRRNRWCSRWAAGARWARMATA